MMMEFLKHYRGQLNEAMDHVDLAKVKAVIGWLKDARDQGRTIFTCGNGGSASTASHFACDLVKGASYQRNKRFRVMALTDAAPTISAYSNDVGYNAIFVEQLRNFASAGDVVIGISGSGNSPNVLEAMSYARSLGCRTAGLTGRDGGKLAALVDRELRVPVQHMGVIEDAHLILCHMMAYYFMESKDL
jgi:D-sedoheptulose 7-phosphate isomerase